VLVATIDLEVSGVLASTTFTGVTQANLSSSDDNKATGGLVGDIIRCDLDNVPGDFDTMNNVTLHVEARKTVEDGNRTQAMTVDLLDSDGTTVLETFDTANFGTTDVVYNSTAFTRTDNSTTINGWQLRITVIEGGGMPFTGVNEVDHMWVTLDYSPAAQTLTSTATLTDADTVDNVHTISNVATTRQILIT
jgi:hypothetical protein